MARMDGKEKLIFQMEHHPSKWGTARSDFVLRSQQQQQQPITHTTNPIVTGTSVIAFRYKDGIMMAADCLASYGSLARFRDMKRMVALSEHALIGSSGDVADFQQTMRMLKEYHIREQCFDDGHQLSPRQWFTAVGAFMYQARSKMEPYWNAHVVAGVDPKTGERLLGYANMLGTVYEATCIATGYGAHIALPLLREAVEGREDVMTEQEAKQLIEQCMTVLWYRDARSTDQVMVAKVTAEDGVQISEPFKVAQNWNVALYQFSPQ